MIISYLRRHLYRFGVIYLLSRSIYFYDTFRVLILRQLFFLQNALYLITLNDESLNYVEKISEFVNPNHANKEPEKHLHISSDYNIYLKYDPDSEQNWYLDYVPKEKCKHVLLNMKRQNKDGTFLICRDEAEQSVFNMYLVLVFDFNFKIVISLTKDKLYS